MTETTRHCLYDKDGHPAGYIDIPTAVIDAAVKVRMWLMTQPEGTSIYNLRLDANRNG